MKTILLAIIVWYQKHLSPDHSHWARLLGRPPHCKYIPSCSEYTHTAIERFGVIKGSLLGFFRILRCNPWSQWGHDLVPEKKSQEHPKS